MGTIFISHSSCDNDRAIEIQRWLAANGWDEVFLDLDPQRGITAGQRWKEALQQAAHRCEVVLALLSPEWLASDWCKAELNAAQLMGKKIIVALIGVEKSRVPVDLSEEQWVDLDRDPDAWTRLKEGLRRVGLDPSSFPFEAGRRPYPGFAFLEEKDAAIFFGRDAQIVRGLDKIRSIVRAGVERMLVILGASGSGKSSFLRAGLWPRLKRDDRTWLPLPIIRPERAVLSGQFGLAQALQNVMREPAFADQVRKRDLPRSRATIQEFIDTTEDGLAKIFAALRSIAHVPPLSGETAPPLTIVLAVDQGEELFNEEGRDEARRFVEILTRTLKADPGVLVLVAMRSDAFPQLQSEPALVQLPKDTFTLDMMLEGSYRAVIEGPAQLVKPNPLKIDPQLTDALLEDLTGQDALPLLAFTLAHLYERYAADNELILADYEKLGRLKGVIDSTVREAFAEGVAKGELPKDVNARFALARAAFIPHLARVNAAGQFVRRVATRSEISTKAWSLIDHFAERRLLIKDRRKVAGQDLEVVEVAHEALLREWRELHDALLAEREFLVAKSQLEQDVAEWQAASENHKSGALLSGNKLLRAREWLISRPQDLSVTERQFIKASSDQEFSRRRWRRAAVVVAFIAISGFAGYAMKQSWEAVAERQRADSELKKAQMTQSLFLADLAHQQRIGGDAGTAVLLALEALPDGAARTTRPYVHEAEFQLDGAWRDLTERLILRGHEGPVRSAAFSPDGKRIVTASDDYTARLWDAETGKQIGQPLEGHSRGVLSAAFEPKGTRIITASLDKTARLWDAGTGKQIGEPLGHPREVFSAAFSPTGELIVSASGDERARLWDAATGRQINERIMGLKAAFSPDGDRILTVMRNLIIRTDRANITVSGGETPWVAQVWDARTGSQTVGPLFGDNAIPRENLIPNILLSGRLSPFPEIFPGPAVHNAVFSPDGNRIVIASSRWALQRNAETGKQIGEPLKGHAGEVWSAKFSPDGKLIVTASHDRTTRLWDAETGKQVGEPLKGHEGPVRSAAFSPDGKRIVTASDDYTARLWDAETGKQIGKPLDGHKGRVLSAAISDTGKSIIAIINPSTARLWDVETGKSIGVPLGHANSIFSVAFSPDGKRVVTASADNTALVWDTETSGRIGEPLKGHAGWVRKGEFSPDGKRIVTASHDRTARLWDAETGRQVGEPLKGHEGPVRSAAFSSDARRIVTASEDNTARLWDAETGKQIGEPLKGHERPVQSAAFSPDARRIVTASEDNTARLWDAETGKQIGEPLKGHERPVQSAAFSSDGKRIVTVSVDYSARLWDAETGKQVGEPLKAHEGSVRSVAFSPNGKRVVDSYARLWDAETGKQVGEPLKTPEGSVRSVAFTPDSKRIVVLLDNNTVVIKEIFADTQALVSQAKAATPRCLTAAQRNAFFLPPGPPLWCIELEKWPYHTQAWKQWLSDIRGGKNSPLPSQ